MLCHDGAKIGAEGLYALAFGNGAIDSGGKIGKEIVRINFPEGIEHIYVPSELVGPKLVEMSVAKLRNTT